MPQILLVILTLVVAAYVVQASLAAVGFHGTRRQPAPELPDHWPRVTVVVMASPEAENVDTTVESIRNCSYPEDRLDIQVLRDGPTGSQKSMTACGLESKKSGAELVFITESGVTVDPDWIRSMVRRGTPDTPLVVGPITDEHEELFLPRLQALQRYGEIAHAAGLHHLGIPPGTGVPTNVAIRPDDRPDEPSNQTVSTSSLVSLPVNGDLVPATFTVDPPAAASRPPVPSFDAYFDQLVRSWQATFRGAHVARRALDVESWLTHSLLLGCGLGAIVLPDWRQPTLLAFLAKMGGDVLLMVPAAQHFGERRLMRSLVPTELLMVGTIPFAGGLAFWKTLGS